METPYSKDENEQAWTAWQCLTRTNINLFLTGRAGTGKTTFLRKLADSHLKSMVITAPTGVAAINAGGVTIHSFFQIPPGTFPPGERPPMERKIRTSKLRVIRSLDLLVIDEVSMVRADLLDMVDARLREIRQNERPFGGVQLLPYQRLLIHPDLMIHLTCQYPECVSYPDAPVNKNLYDEVSQDPLLENTLSLPESNTVPVQHVPWITQNGHGLHLSDSLDLHSSLQNTDT